jgi:hypothetical protein
MLPDGKAASGTLIPPTTVEHCSTAREYRNWAAYARFGGTFFSENEKISGKRTIILQINAGPSLTAIR